ncbi:HDIG domain-containing protein [Eubacteriales bacterium OttesenSCG-928-N13]|nr:HDIG domain-containing protein [Eubacteriales bacterium OttesenSCG-928-N13]
MRTKKARWSVRPSYLALLIAIVTLALLFAAVAMSVTPEQYDFKVGEVSYVTITATKNVVDETEKKRMIDEAERKVPLSYNNDATVMPVVMNDLTALTSTIDGLPALRTLGNTKADTATDEMLRSARTMLPSDLALTDDQVRLLVEADSSMLSQLSTDALLLMRETLSGGLLEGQEQEALSKMKRDLSNDGYPDPLVAVYGVVMRHCMHPNVLLDTEKIEEERARARDEIEANPPMYLKGQAIVRANNVVTASNIELLNSLNMLKDRGVGMKLYIGLAIVLLLLGLMMALYLRTFERSIWNDPRKIALIAIICLLVVGMSLASRLISPHLMPVVLGAMLTTLLLKSRLALMVNLVLSVIAGLLASSDGGMFTTPMFSVMLASFISGSCCVVVIRNRRQRVSVLVAGLMVGVINALVTIGVVLIDGTETIVNNMMSWAVQSAASGLWSAVLCIGFQLVLELLFNLDTNVKLAELSNPNQPLLRRLMLEAPGTYHHSMVVANLAEAAANAVGANGMLARVGSYYHDIGKLKRPIYFKENQIHDNPHDRTDPRVSTAILTAHPRDGVEMAQKARIPYAIQEIIQQHHGDTPVLFFYDKAVKQGGDVDIADFRYDGPRPQKSEAAIVMLADTVEAAVRAMGESSTDKIAQTIQRLVRSKMEDGQLDQCNLTFRDLNLICEAFMQVLNGIYHERIEYPTVDIPVRNRLEEQSVGETKQEPSESPAEAKLEEAPSAEEHEKSKIVLPPATKPEEAPSAEEHEKPKIVLPPEQTPEPLTVDPNMLHELPTADGEQEQEDES